MGVHYKKLLNKHNIHENQFNDSHDFTRRCKFIYIPYFPYSLTVTLLSGRPGNNSSEINCSGTYYERTEWCLERRPHDRVANHTHSIDHMTGWPTTPIPSAIQNVLKHNLTKHNTYWLLEGKIISSVYVGLKQRNCNKMHITRVQFWVGC